jgi:long-subunit acyl-CoA synthetase (AMP-forming)
MGGNLKFMIIGTAPSLANIKEFFQKIGLPLFEGYGLTELGMISMNDYSKNKLFTVGTIFPGIKVDFREDNVLWVKNSYQRMNKYLNEESDLIDKDGYICTGDIGEIDKAGFLKIVGRKKEIIVTSTGKKINPIPIEQMFISYSEIKHCVLIGDNKPFISAIISPKEIQFKSNLEFENRINEIVKTINNDLSSAEKVLAAIISKKEFSEKTGMVTRSQKIVRRKVEECHTYEIKKIYDEQ